MLSLALTLLPAALAHSPHRVEFLSVSSPDDTMGPNLNFAPLSTTMKCTINLTLQYMVIFTALGVCRTYLDFKGLDYHKSEVQKALKHASETVFFAPMACLMFVGFRMRVLQLTKGDGNPQEWVQFAMEAMAYSILANTILVLLVPIFTKHEVATDPETGDIKTEDGAEGNPFENKILAILFSALRYVTFLGLYVGFGTVCYGLFTYEPPAGVWDGPVPPVSPAVGCTCVLALAFFAVYFFVALARTYTQFMPSSAGSLGVSTFEHVVHRAADTLGMAPMLCVLFLGARMRALQMDPLHGSPQKWAQQCFYMCTYALVAQALVAVSVPLALGGTVKKAKIEGDMEYDVGGGFLAKALTVFRYVIMLCVYAGAIAVVCSVFTIEHPQGKELTPEVSPTMLCVINLSFQYFLIYALLWAFITVEDFAGELSFLVAAKEALESAKATVSFAPMLAVLFVATRMRALQITENRGAPQGYAQSGMYLASWAVFVQFVMCLIMPLCTGKAYHTDTLSGPETPREPQKPSGNTWSAMVATAVRYLALVALLGGITCVLTAVFLMTPENATGRGSLPVIGEYVQPPPVPTDVAGVGSAMEAAGEGIGGTVEAANSGVKAVAG